MTLFVSPTTPGSPIIDVSGTNIDFSISINGGVADITALGYFVDVTLTGTTANVYWYQITSGSTPYYTYWHSIEGFGITGASIRSVGSYNGAMHLWVPTGSAVGHDPVGSPAWTIWYPNAYYYNPGSYYRFFMGYTFNCPYTGNYQIKFDDMYLGCTQSFGSPYTIEYEATVQMCVAGVSGTPSTDSYSGNISGYMTTHPGETFFNVPLVSGTHYSFEATADINITSLPHDPGSFARWALSIPGDPWYIITGVVAYT